jgi:nucleoside-diphosphate-sugar epimerase
VKVLVTGGTGYLGQAVVHALHDAGHELVLYGRSVASSGLPGASATGDIRDRARVGDAARGCDAIVHLAGLVAVWRRRAAEFDEVNVGGLQNVIDAARAHGTPRVVYTSSFMALAPRGASRPGEWNDYQRTKVAADLVAARAVDAGVPLIRTYPGVVYGPGPLTDGNLVGRQIADYLRRRLPGVVGARRTWSFAFVDDVAAAHVAALERGAVGGRYVLGGENAPQMRVFEIVARLTGRPLPMRIPAWAATAVALVYEARAAFLRVPPLVTTGTLEILLRDWPLASDLAASELGYRITALEAGVGRTVTWLIEQALPPSDRGTSRPPERS